MEQKKRLVELLKKADESASNKMITDYEDAIKDNADYLIANNVVVLPCKVGDTVYSFSTDFGVVLPYLVGTINIGYMGKSGVYYSYEANCHDPETDELLDEIDFDSEDIGKTVFLSREEDEAKLREMKDGKY
jgi:hypothetical protein